eukprot:4619985-Amphidinium_carterae.1
MMMMMINGCASQVVVHSRSVCKECQKSVYVKRTALKLLQQLTAFKKSDFKCWLQQPSRQGPLGPIWGNKETLETS